VVLPAFSCWHGRRRRTCQAGGQFDPWPQPVGAGRGQVFAERIGLDPATFLKVARASASYSQVMETKGPKMVRSDFSVEGRVKQTLKDAHLMLVQAAAVGQKLSALELHADMLEACVRAGEADLDNSVIIKEVRRRGANQGGNGGGLR